MLEFTFQLHAQGYDFYFSHSTPASAGVCTAVRCSLGVTAVKLKGIPRRLLPLDLQKNGKTLCILNVYALNVLIECKEFFGEMEKLVFRNVMVLGDFNCVTDKQDCTNWILPLHNYYPFLDLIILWSLRECIVSASHTIIHQLQIVRVDLIGFMSIICHLASGVNHSMLHSLIITLLASVCWIQLIWACIHGASQWTCWMILIIVPRSA